MKKTYTYIVLIVLLGVFASGGTAHAEITSTLHLGSSGAQVRELQAFLNKDPDTQIATSGVGSIGNETNYFGTLTYLAVKKFQTKYAYEVLSPTGLSSATGYVGTYTLAKIARLQALSPVVVGPLENQPTTISTSPKIISINPNPVVSSWAMVSVTGENFATVNTVLTSGGPEAGVFGLSSDGKSLTFQFTFSTADKMKSQLAPYVGTTQYQQVLTSFLANLTGDEIVRSGANTYARVIIVIKNSNGQSAPAIMYVDLGKALTN